MNPSKKSMKMWIAALASLALKRRLLSFAAPVRSLWRRRGRHAPLQARSALLLGCRLGIFLILLSVLPTTTQAAVNQNTTLNPPNLNSGLIGHWTFDGKDMLTNVRDSSGQGNTGVLVAAATSSQQVAGPLGQALKFNGSTQYVNEPTSISSIQSVGFWAQTASTTAQGLINLTGSTVYISTNANKVISGTGFTSPTYYVDGSASTTPGLYNANWHYVVVIGTAAITGSQLEIARANTQYFAGSIDDPRIYNRALSAAEVLQLYNQGATSHQNVTVNPPNLNSGLVGHWTFDGKDMTRNVADTSGLGNTGYMVAAATSTQQKAGVIGQALSFNGTTQYVDAGNTAVLTITNNILSASAWVKKANSGDNNEVMVEKGVGGGGGYVLGIGPLSSCSENQIKVTKYGVADICVGTFPQNTNWHMVTAVWGSTGVTVYVDGAVIGTNSNTSNFVTISASFKIAQGGINNYFNGTIDDVRIYNRALSAAEVTQLYNLGH